MLIEITEWWSILELVNVAFSCKTVFLTVKLLTSKSDQHLISLYNIIRKSNIKVRRMKEMITN